MGAQGLMQVMTRVHDDKYSAYGGDRAALDPLSNLRVGVQVLRDCIQRAGGVTEGLRHYVGAANLESDGGYGAKVLFEQEQLKAVASGRAPARNAAPVQRENPPEADEGRQRPTGGTRATLRVAARDRSDRYTGRAASLAIRGNAPRWTTIRERSRQAPCLAFSAVRLGHPHSTRVSPTDVLP
jgi:hypothetical protein